MLKGKVIRKDGKVYIDLGGGNLLSLDDYGNLLSFKEAENENLPLITEEHVNHAPDLLTKLLYKIFYNKKITKNYLKSEIRTFYSKLGLSSKKINSYVNSLVRVVTSGNPITFKNFRRLIELVLGYEIVEISIKLRNKEGKEEIFTVTKFENNEEG